MTNITTALGKLDVPRLLVDVAYVIIGVALATGLAWPVYASPRMILVAVAAAVLGIALVVVGRVLGWRWWITARVAAGLYLVTVVPLAIPVALSSPLRALQGILDGVTGVVLGWKQIVTLTLPLGEYQAVLVPFFLTIFVGSIVATALSIGHRKYSSFSVGVVFLMCAFGPVFGSSTTDPPLNVVGLTIPAPRQVLLGILFVVVSLVWLIVRARMERKNALRRAMALSTDIRQSSHSTVWMRLRRRAFAAILIVVAVTAGLLVAPAAAGWAPRETLRDRVNPEVVVLQQPSPLSDYRSWFSAQKFDEQLFTIDGDLAGVDRVRLATLGYYDGAVFRPGSRTGQQQFRRLPSASNSGVKFTITIGDGYSGVWLPTPGLMDSTPTFTGPLAEKLADGSYVGSQGESAVVVTPRVDGGFGVRPGDSYRISVAPSVGGEVAGSVRGGESLISDDDYPALAAWVEQQDVPRTAAGVVELIQRLRDRGYLSHSLQNNESSKSWIKRLAASDFVFQPSYAGHSAARVEELFTALYDQQRAVGEDAEPESLVAAIGDDEQFATAAALLARFLGFDSRIVVGARLVSDDDKPAVEPCTAGVCTGANVTAWVEFRASGAAWFAADASPQYALSPFRVNPGEERPQNPTVAQDVTTEVLDPPPAQRDDSSTLNPGAGDTAGWVDTILPILKAVGTGALTLLLLLLPLLFLVILKIMRRRSRRSAVEPEVSLVGVWDELMDTYLDYGVKLPDHATRGHMASVIGRPNAATLAVIIDAGVFAEYAPTRESADAAWELLRAERAELASEVKFSARVKAALALRSFVRYLPARAGLSMGLSLFRPKEVV